MKRRLLWVGPLILALAAVVLWLVSLRTGPVVDDAKAAGKTVADFPETDSHAFDEMDGGVSLSAEERRGRNTWLLWTAGDQTFWDGMARHGLGLTDFLKVVDSRHRGSRFKDTGLINQPGFEAATQPDESGLWLDSGPQEPGVDAAVYGRPSGIVGLRIYPNPQFDAAARRQWDPKRYWNDPNYSNDPNLVRPYVVGMSCAFCHVAFNPTMPPEDPERPEWRNLSSTIGNQYLNASAVFAIGATPDSYAYQLIHSWARGTIDTSFLATDNLNNPGKMNPIYAIPARLSIAHEEEISGGAMNLPGEQSRMAVPHVLKDGADSVGIIGALSRVYVSIGEDSQQWLLHHNILVGGKPQSPFSVLDAQKNSVYWQATAQRIPSLAEFLAKMKGPRLLDAPEGTGFLTSDSKLLQRGKIVFAENCARCHSSKQPPAESVTSTEQYLNWMRAEVQKPDFLKDNFLSTEDRIPVNVVGTNAARALATNAIGGHVWDNFSSKTYKQLPSIGEIEVQHPLTGAAFKFQAPAGGPGYYRVPSLIGIWASAPLLHNNSIGTYTGDPSVAGRMLAFNDAMTRLLWPEKRRGTDSIARTSVESFLEIPAVYLPKELQFLAHDGSLRIGPIPAGTPIDLLANADLDLSSRDKTHDKTMDRIRLVTKVQSDLATIRIQHLNSEQARKVLENLVPDLLKISKCPDFVLDRGHLFGADLSDADKLALIEFIKTF
jgi:hypothetical protein